MAVHIMCPLPELADALQPYIRTREETSRIRRTIGSRFLGSGSNQKLSRYTSARGSDVVDASVSVDADEYGIISGYARATAAHHSSSQRLANLQLKLAQLGAQKTLEGPESRLDEVLLALEHLRNEQRRRKLLILENAVNAAEREKEQSPFGRSSHVVNNDKHVLPPPSINAQPRDVASHGCEVDITTLKKAVIVAQGQADTDVAVLDDGATYQSIDDEEPKCAMSAALSHTRDEMVRWFEGELARIPEHEQHHEGAEGAVITAPTNDDKELNEGHVSDAYADYIDARRALIDALAVMRDEHGETPLSAQQINPQTRGESATQGSQRSTASPTPAVQVLPYAQSLYDMTAQESNLLQESTFLRRQLAWNADKTGQLLHRLADESHLVAPGAKDAFAWAEAGNQVREDDARNNHVKVLAGEQSLREAQASAVL